jgi:hypothetical protein
MTDQGQSKTARKKTPEDSSEFEREQLRFFLSGADLAETLSSINPSLAWLPVLSQLELIQSDTQLITWIERNFSEVDAIRDVVANIHFFGPDTANFLEFRLNIHAASLPPLLAKCWALIIQHMRIDRRRIVNSEWFEIAPQLKSGKRSAPLLERLAHALRPKLKIGKKLFWGDIDKKAPEHPSDLMAIDYEVDDGFTADEVLAAWPTDATAEADENLLSQLTVALSAALAEATDAGVEGNEAYGTTDSDVPSVAEHGQNSYHTGFQAITRVMAEVWKRLALRSVPRAQAVAERWRDTPFCLVRRLALFAFYQSHYRRWWCSGHAHRIAGGRTVPHPCEGGGVQANPIPLERVSAR